MITEISIILTPFEGTDRLEISNSSYLASLTILWTPSIMFPLFDIINKSDSTKENWLVLPSSFSDISKIYNNSNFKGFFQKNYISKNLNLQ
ncbi:TPA: hypothetical protein DCX15_00130 [bacterium]|nr:hypothetical protein [bacterium]